jgi:vitellogenic carboxypeptidase-like protein
MKQNSTYIFQIGIQTFLNQTGFPWYFNFEHYEHFRGDLITENFVKQREWRDALHAGNVPFQNMDTDIVLFFLLNDYMDSVAPSVYQLLQNNYRVLFYNGQQDLSVPYIATVAAIRRLYFKDWFKYLYHTKRNVWRVGDEVAGFSKTGELIWLLPYAF